MTTNREVLARVARRTEILAEQARARARRVAAEENADENESRRRSRRSIEEEHDSAERLDGIVHEIREIRESLESEADAGSE